MPKLDDATQALESRAKDVVSRMQSEGIFGTSGLGIGGFALSVNKLEDGLTTASGILNREARFGRAGTDEYEQLAKAAQQADEVLRVGGALLVAQTSAESGGTLPLTAGSALAVPTAFEMPKPSSMLVGGVIGFGLAWLALKWLSTRGLR